MQIVEDMKAKERKNLERIEKSQRGKKHIEEERDHMELEIKKKTIRLEEI